MNVCNNNTIGAIKVDGQATDRMATPHGDANLLICITFLFRRSRMKTLFQVLHSLCDLEVERLEIVIFTETSVLEELVILNSLLRKFQGPSISTNVISRPDARPDLLLLSWKHKELVRDRFSDPKWKYSHLVYLEEDTRFSAANFRYFVKFRELLRPHGLVPGFVRVEFNDRYSDIYLPDIAKSNSRRRGRASVGRHDFLCLDEPYAAVHVLDRELVLEYIESPSFDIKGSLTRINWGPAERSAMGITFENPPAGFPWRVVVPILRDTMIPDRMSWIHHIPNNYTNNYEPTFSFPLGKLRIDELFHGG